MKMPKGARTQEDAVAMLATRYTHILKFVLAEIDDLAKSGIADQRWCAIARTDIEKGFMSLNQALPSARDGRNYGKAPRADADQNPAEFTPPVDPGSYHTHQIPPNPNVPPLIEWKDVGTP